MDFIVRGQFREYTGDNLHEQAEKLNPCFSETKMRELKEIGETLNYNGYEIKNRI